MLRADLPAVCGRYRFVAQLCSSLLWVLEPRLAGPGLPGPVGVDTPVPRAFIAINRHHHRQSRLYPHRHS